MKYSSNEIFMGGLLSLATSLFLFSFSNTIPHHMHEIMLCETVVPITP